MEPNPSLGLPRRLVVVGSVIIVIHFLAVIMVVMAAPSGPWLTEYGATPATGPQFGDVLGGMALRNYLHPMMLGLNYHFVSNQPELPSVRLEVRLKDQDGKVFETVQLPDEDANFWVRHRQQMVAANLGGDLEVPQPAPGEQIERPGARPALLAIWDRSPDDPMWHLQDVSQLRLRDKFREPGRNRVLQPSRWAQTIAASLGRYYCRTYGAHSAEVIRIHRNPLPPDLLRLDEDDTKAFVERFGLFVDQKFSFGEFRP